MDLTEKKKKVSIVALENKGNYNNRNDSIGGNTASNNSNNAINIADTGKNSIKSQNTAINY